ncbi:MAG: hypothetical protein QM709_01645 [Spongiibacteraceae bacterium]
MLSALIIILREVLEAGLIISALLATARIKNISPRTLMLGLFFGIGGALLIANNMVSISNFNDGVGQELLNATLDIGIIAMLAGASVSNLLDGPPLFGWCAAGAIACAVSREVSEIIIYASSFSASFSAFIPVLIGGTIGTGIGLSIGALLYYFLAYQPSRLALLISSILLALIAAGMGAEAVGYFDQAGLIPAQPPFWNTSSWIAEDSIGGQILHALIGYEATPTLLQLIAYALTFLFISGLGALRVKPEADA